MLVVSGLWREGFDEFMDGMVEVYECIPGLFKCRGHPDVLMRRPRHCWPTEQEMRTIIPNMKYINVTCS